ncbi:MAG TPA: tyrosine-type recombinase/integrase [Ktedonobacterales bacterium]
MSKPSHPSHEDPTQPSLFGSPPGPATQPDLAVTLAPVTASTTLAAVSPAYADYLRRTEHTDHTIACFLSDLRLLSDRIGRQTPIGAVTREQLADWLEWLRFDRSAKKPAPKTMARRVTFLRNFFHWLAVNESLSEDLSEQIALTRPTPPLPELLFEDDVVRLVEVARANPRDHVLISLLVDAGLKKEELLNLRVGHVDLSDAEHPAVEVHFRDHTRPQRERRMELPADFTEAYRAYLAAYKVHDPVFDCTERNMNYILRSIVEKAGVTKRVTLQLLRDVYAVRQLRAGIAPEALREKLGLSPEAWYETSDKYHRLAFPA